MKKYSLFTPLRAFSLIEILVTLIIMSLLVSAFIPVVTKKLKSSDITVGSFGTAVTTDECEQFSSQHYKCILCTKNSCSLCTSQMGLDDGLYVDPSKSCDPKECKDAFGANCATCNKDRCTSCPNTTPADSYADPSENCIVTKCSDKYEPYCATCNKNSCTSCKTPTPTGQYANLEENCKLKNCSEKFGSYCTSCTKDSCTSCASGSGYNTLTNKCERCNAGYYSPGGAEGCKKCDAGKISSAGAASCSDCSVASHKVANADGTACVNKYCGAGQYIDGVTCISCSGNSYQTSTSHQNTSCSACASTCGACNKTTGKCSSCNSPYTLSSSGTCTLGCNPQTVTLSGTTTQVTRFNMGDDPNCSRDVIASLSGVTFAPAGTSCSGDYCCWYGQTAASTCTDMSGGIYSGCNRTVCKWGAANKICTSIGTGWALPATSTAMSTWYSANSKAATGLMLCDDTSSSTNHSRCGLLSSSCLGAKDNRCYAYHVWAYSKQDRYLRGNSWTAQTSNGTQAYSVRCVK